jgi:hypothetical protein
MLKRIFTVSFICMILLQPQALFGYCTKPYARAPQMPWTDPPSPPACISYGDVSQCEDWELRKYREETEEFIISMQRYADEVRNYANEAAEYTECLAREAEAEYNSNMGW